MTTDIFLQLLDDAFVDVRYELVVLPEHLLPKRSGQRPAIREKKCRWARSYAIREWPGTLNCPRLPAFAFNVAVGERCHYMYSWS